MTPHCCLLCGYVPVENPREVATALIRWIDPEGEPFGYTPRCNDRAACRARADAAGVEWLVLDGSDPRLERPTGHTAAHRRTFEAARKWRDQRPAMPEAAADPPRIEVDPELLSVLG